MAKSWQEQIAALEHQVQRMAGLEGGYTRAVSGGCDYGELGRLGQAKSFQNIVEELRLAHPQATEGELVKLAGYERQRRLYAGKKKAAQGRLARLKRGGKS